MSRVGGDQAVAAAAPVSTDTPQELWREDLIGALLSTAMVFGLFLDGWNHINLQEGALGSFFTPWHAALYAGFALSATWVLTRNPHLYMPVKAKPELHRLLGIPLRYPYAVAGIVLATVGILGDSIWHTVFGTETGVARVIGPFHLLLFTGASALIAAPLRSAWHAHRHYPAVTTFRHILPPLISLTLLTAVMSFMFQWLSAFLDWKPSLQIGALPRFATPPIVGTVEFAGTARIVMTNLILMSAVLLALRRWRLPFGSVTFLFTAVAVMMSGLAEFDLWSSIVASALGGLAADVMIQRLRPSPQRPFALRSIATAVPIVLWTAYFVLIRLIDDLEWPLDLWIGTVITCAVTTLFLSFLAVPPAVHAEAWPEDA
jgi:hypothetical protein